MMAVTEAHNTVYMIVYATNSKILRKIIIAEEDWHYAAVHQYDLGPGESYIFAAAGNNDAMPEWENHVHTVTGIVPPNATCAVIQNGVVIRFCQADPEIDAPPEGCRLVLLNGKQYRLGDRFDYRTL